MMSLYTLSDALVRLRLMQLAITMFLLRDLRNQEELEGKREFLCFLLCCFQMECLSLPLQSSLLPFIRGIMGSWMRNTWSWILQD